MTHWHGSLASLATLSAEAMHTISNERQQPSAPPPLALSPPGGEEAPPSGENRQEQVLAPLERESC